MSSVSSSSAADRDKLLVQNIGKLMEDPVSFLPLTTAVSLVPCAHNVNEDIAIRLFGSMANGRVNGPPSKCPECKQIVQSYQTDHRMRAIVQALVGSVDLPWISKAIQADIEPDIASIPYPGKGAKFVSNFDWNRNLTHGGNALCRQNPLYRQLELISESKDTYLRAMEVCGYEDGSLSLAITLRNDHSWSYNETHSKEREFHQYLINVGLIPPKLSDFSFYFSVNKENTKKLFRVVALHNEIPEKEFSLIRSLVESGDWKTVTPWPLPSSELGFGKGS